jgi:hypothetical protein
MSAMEIVLVRHGRPVPPPGGFLRGDALGEWLRWYDAADLDARVHAPADLRCAIASASYVLSSDARRAP